MLLNATVIWCAAALAVVAIVAPYVVVFSRRRGLDRGRKAEAAALGIDRPQTQSPCIDVLRCIGCRSCVAACPEGDVLGIVGGTSTVINGLRCVGHGRCAEACPVGAIEICIADLKNRTDVPLTDPTCETNVPGLYIVGELGGQALVRNAVTQARRAMGRIVERVRSDARVHSEFFDVVIVGAGPAGLAAAGIAREQDLSHVVLEQEQDLGGTVLHYPRRKLVLVQPMEIPLWGWTTKDEYSKEELLDIFHRVVQRARVDIRFGHKVVTLRGTRGAFAVECQCGTVLQARRVVLALGRRGTPRKLGVPGEELSKVMYQLLDAESYHGQHLLVVGGGDSALEAAIGLARQGDNDVTLSYRREKLVRVKKKNEDRFQELVAQRRLRPLFDSQVSEILPGCVLLSVGRESPRALELRNDYVFVFAGGDPPFELVKRMGVRFGGPAPAPAAIHETPRPESARPRPT